MSLNYTFTCPLPNGLHARPASLLAERASPFTSRIELLNLRTGATADARSVLALIAADVAMGDRCELRITGADESAAMSALHRFIDRELPHCDEALPAEAAAAGTVALPRMLRDIQFAFTTGKPLCAGIGEGQAVMLGGLSLPANMESPASVDAQQEQSKLTQAVAAVRAAISAKLASATSRPESGILKAHLSIAGDSLLIESIAEAIRRGRNAAQAVVDAGSLMATRLRSAASAYIRERAADVQDICAQLLEHLCGEKFNVATGVLSRPSIVFADHLSPRQFLQLDRRHLRGLVLEHAAANSHTIILARSFSIPVLSDVKIVQLPLTPNQPAIVDATIGILVRDPPAPVRRYYQLESTRIERRREKLSHESQQPARTVDGLAMQVSANVASAEEAIFAFERGADGVGVFRTEMLFMDRDTPPDEEEQFAAYRRAAEAAAGRPVIIRTLDIGGDKPLAYLNLPRETNPYLGRRGVRLYPEHTSLLDTQLRAICRASAFGDVRLMVPMVATLAEVRWVKARLATIQRDLNTAGVKHNPSMSFGIMVEVPSIAFILDQLAAEVDFFSIGSNDLCQYFLAADRDSAAVSGLYSPHHPSFIRFLKHIADAAHAAGRRLSVCGEMAGDPANLPLLIALGMDQISMGAAQIPSIKSAISRQRADDCRDALSAAMACQTADEVEAILRDTQTHHVWQPLLSRELILIDNDSATKAEAIKQIADAFYVAGRTDAPPQVEDAVWAREAVYSTGLGFGFAIPHCKTDAMISNSIGVLRLRQPIDWGSLDGQPVRMVILLAMRESDKDNAHMKVFAILARKLMHEDFRDRVLAAPDADSILKTLTEELAIAG